MKARIHPNKTEFWNPVVVENGLFPMKSVTLNGVAAKRVGNNSGGNAWEASGQKPPYVVRATDVNGNAISFNVAGNGDAFGVANGADVSVLNLLLAVNSRSQNGLLYDLDGDGDANDAVETSWRTMANNVFTAINEAGDI